MTTKGNKIAPGIDDRHFLASKRSDIAIRHLDDALQRIVNAVTSKNERIALDAARWIAEMALGKPRQVEPEGGGDTRELAHVLAQTLREVVEQQRAIPPPPIETTYRDVTQTSRNPVHLDEESFPDA